MINGLVTPIYSISDKDGIRSVNIFVGKLAHIILFSDGKWALLFRDAFGAKIGITGSLPDCVKIIKEDQSCASTSVQ